jgi:hypothetical protein
MSDPARYTRQVLHHVQRGRTAIIESHDQSKAPNIDIVDYLIVWSLAVIAHLRPTPWPRDNRRVGGIGVGHEAQIAVAQSC